MGIIRRAISFVRAVTGGRDRKLINARLAICRKCTHLKEVKWFDEEALKEKARMFCGACGCPTLPIAELGHKLGYRKLRCPVCVNCGKEQYPNSNGDKCVCEQFSPKWGEITSLDPKEATQVIRIRDSAEQQVQYAREHRGQGVAGRGPFPASAQQLPGSIPASVAAQAMRPMQQTEQQKNDDTMYIPAHLPESTKQRLREIHANIQAQQAAQQQAQAQPQPATVPPDDGDGEPPNQAGQPAEQPEDRPQPEGD